MSDDIFRPLFTALLADSIKRGLVKPHKDWHKFKMVPASKQFVQIDQLPKKRKAKK